MKSTSRTPVKFKTQSMLFSHLKKDSSSPLDKKVVDVAFRLIVVIAACHRDKHSYSHHLTPAHPNEVLHERGILVR